MFWGSVQKGCPCGDIDDVLFQLDVCSMSGYPCFFLILKQANTKTSILRIHKFPEMQFIYISPSFRILY